jgi:hypothetical protein
VTAPPAERGLDVSLYRSGVALVRDRRSIALEAGRQRLRWPGIADAIRPDTVGLAGAQTTLMGYRRAHRRLTLPALLSAHIGREVRVASAGGAVFAGELVSADPVLVATEAGLRSAAPRDVVFPDGLGPGFGVARALALDVAAQQGRHQALTLHYLTGGLEWSLDYVGVLSADGERLSLAARASITNTSGLDLHGAEVELIAGSPRLPGARKQPREAQMQVQADRASDTAQPEKAGLYYRLALPEPLRLATGEQATRALFQRSAIPVERVHVLRQQARAYKGRGAAGWQRVPLITRLQWTVGQGPQPAGSIRVYEPRAQADGRRLVGGADMPDRPEGTQARIAVGRPFDITARRRRTAYQRHDNGEIETVTHEIQLRNAAKHPAAVRVEETIRGDWKMLESSHDWQRGASNLAVWAVEVPAEGERTLRYKARIRR